MGLSDPGESRPRTVLEGVGWSRARPRSPLSRLGDTAPFAWEISGTWGSTKRSVRGARGGPRLWLSLCPRNLSSHCFPPLPGPCGHGELGSAVLSAPGCGGVTTPCCLSPSPRAPGAEEEGDWRSSSRRLRTDGRGQALPVQTNRCS